MEIGAIYRKIIRLELTLSLIFILIIFFFLIVEDMSCWLSHQQNRYNQLKGMRTDIKKWIISIILYVYLFKLDNPDYPHPKSVLIIRLISA